MTPDELPADMEGRLAEFADWLRPSGTEPCPYTSARIGTDLRALLKAYQERGRALEEIKALPDMSKNPADDFDRGARAARLDAADMAEAALNQKGDEL